MAGRANCGQALSAFGGHPCHPTPLVHWPREGANRAGDIHGGVVDTHHGVEGGNVVVADGAEGVANGVARQGRPDPGQAGVGYRSCAACGARGRQVAVQIPELIEKAASGGVGRPARPAQGVSDVTAGLNVKKGEGLQAHGACWLLGLGGQGGGGGRVGGARRGVLAWGRGRAGRTQGRVGGEDVRAREGWRVVTWCNGGR
jgi:hypothetical protein